MTLRDSPLTVGRKRTPKRRSLDALLDLTGRIAVVTGAASGIGQAISRRLGEAGAELILVDRDEAGLECTREQLERSGVGVKASAFDLGDKAAIERFWAGVAHPGPDILVNNAGVFPGRAFNRVDQEFYDGVFAVNLDAVFWMCQGLVKQRAGRGGVIVNIGSIEAILPFKDDLAVYSVSKAGVIALTRALAREHARHGLRVNAVLPGGIFTPGTKQVATDLLRGRVGLLKTGYDFLQRLPAGRMGEPDEVARVVLFLASDLASYMHGAIVPVDGGFLST